MTCDSANSGKYAATVVKCCWITVGRPGPVEVFFGLPPLHLPSHIYSNHYRVEAILPGPRGLMFDPFMIRFALDRHP